MNPGVALMRETGCRLTLERNPYLLVPLLPWAAVDRLGTKLLAEQGVEKPREDSRRLVGAVDAAVKSLIQVGSTASQAEAFTELVAQKIRRDASASVVSMAMTEGIRQGAILTGNGLYRAPGCATMEDDVARRLHTLLQDTTSPIHIPSIEDLASELRRMQLGGRNLHEEQVLATARLLQNPLGCLQGGAGVGKTTTLQAVCDMWASLGGNLVLCAIAGKAALKLSRATHRLAMTVARLLMQLSERERIEREPNRDSYSQWRSGSKESQQHPAAPSRRGNRACRHQGSLELLVLAWRSGGLAEERLCKRPVQRNARRRNSS